MLDALEVAIGIFCWRAPTGDSLPKRLVPLLAALSVPVMYPRAATAGLEGLRMRFMDDASAVVGRGLGEPCHRLSSSSFMDMPMSREKIHTWQC